MAGSAQVNEAVARMPAEPLREIRLTPKTAARVIRFHRARLTLQRRAAAGLAGSAPTTWLAREFRNFQAAAQVPAEGLLT